MYDQDKAPNAGEHPNKTKKSFQSLGPQVFSTALDPEDAKGYTNCSKVLCKMLKMTKKLQEWQNIYFEIPSDMVVAPLYTQFTLFMVENASHCLNSSIYC